jgi:hypothetical protein
MKQISRFAKSVCSGCLSAAVLMLLSCTAAAAAPAKLEIPSSLDFGIVPQESVNTKTFSIKNPSDAGSGKVKIMVSCSCLEVKPETFELKAHSTADLTVTYRPRSSSGKASNRIYVQQAGSDTPDAVINVTAEVYKLFSSQPSKVDFGLVPIGSPRQSSFQLMALSDKTFRIDKAIFDQSLLDVKYEQQAVLSKQKPLPVSVGNEKRHCRVGKISALESLEVSVRGVIEHAKLKAGILQGGDRGFPAGSSTGGDVCLPGLQGQGEVFHVGDFGGSLAARGAAIENCIKTKNCGHNYLLNF